MKSNKTSRTNITKKRKKNNTLADKLPKDHGEWLELVIILTERALSKPGGKQPYLIRQYDRLKVELEEWRKANV